MPQPSNQPKIDDTQLDPPLSSLLYWTWKNSTSWIKDWAIRNKLKFLTLGTVSLILAVLLRSYLHPLAISIRINAFPITLSLSLLGLCYWLFGYGKSMAASFLLILNIILTVTFIAFEGKPHEYLSHYWHFNELELVEAEKLPLTSYERIQPLNSIRVLASEAMTEVQEVSEPDFVKVDDGYAWTMGIEPSYTISKLFGNVDEIIKVSANAPSPNFSRENRSPVSFNTGESLLLSRNAYAAAIKRFNPWTFFNYEPGSVKYIKNDHGEWIQLVTLIKWKGFIFPRPVFGGVLIVKQSSGLTSSLKTIFTGAGEFISAKNVADHDFLVGQNIVPQKVSRFTASSFRFQQGFMAPMPGYHIGDIRIPDLPGDHNDQPFTAFFKIDDQGKLYHYFALEPFQADKQGLNTSVFIPADGIGPIFVYYHNLRDEALTGVSAIVPKIMESRKNYDWTRNSAAEQRPYIREIGGKTRFFWLTTIVTFKGDREGSNSYIAGSAPDVTLTDAQYKSVVWVNAYHPESWEDQLQEELSSVWQLD